MFVTLPMIEDINAIFGEIVHGLMTEHSDPTVHNFSRNSATPSILGSSFLEVMERLDIDEIALVSDFQATATDRLINLAVGHGYVKGCELNVNPAGMGLVTARRRRGLSTTWADAPAWVAVYVDPKNPAIRVIASASGIWHLLRYDTPGQTVAVIRREVERLGGVFDINNLWVTTSPGARGKGSSAPFRLDEKGVGIVLSGASAQHPSVIKLLDDPEPEPWREEKGQSFRPYALDLSGLVRNLWLDQGLVLRDEQHPNGRLYFDERLNADVGAAKRAADARGQATWNSEVIAISLV